MALRAVGRRIERGFAIVGLLTIGGTTAVVYNFRRARSVRLQEPSSRQQFQYRQELAVLPVLEYALFSDLLLVAVLSSSSCSFEANYAEGAIHLELKSSKRVHPWISFLQDMLITGDS